MPFSDLLLPNFPFIILFEFKNVHLILENMVFLKGSFQTIWNLNLSTSFGRSDHVPFIGSTLHKIFLCTYIFSLLPQRRCSKKTLTLANIAQSKTNYQTIKQPCVLEIRLTSHNFCESVKARDLAILRKPHNGNNITKQRQCSTH